MLPAREGKIHGSGNLGRTEDRNRGKLNRNREVSHHKAGSQELLELESAEEAGLAATLEKDSRAEAEDKGKQCQVSQGEAKLCLHKTKLDWDPKTSQR